MILHNTTSQKLFPPFISTDGVKSHHGEECWGFNSLQLGYIVSKVGESIPELLSIPTL